jgi:hypothetical protein
LNKLHYFAYYDLLAVTTVQKKTSSEVTVLESPYGLTVSQSVQGRYEEEEEEEEEERGGGRGRGENNFVL